MAEARAQGFDRLSLCTYRDVPWNGPFYASLGFTEVARPGGRTSGGCATRSASSVWTSTASAS